MILLVIVDAPSLLRATLGLFMYQTIHEPISVAGVFAKSIFRPTKFQWRERAYPVEKITILADFTDGGRPQRQYSVLSAGNVYRLLYQRDDENWFVEEVWYEG